MPARGYRKGKKEHETPVEHSDIGYTVDGYTGDAPYWNEVLPWLAKVTPCVSHSDVFRDKDTGYVYCKTCGHSFGLL